MALKRGLFAILFLLGAFLPGSAEAGHLYGGAITWECAGGGGYIFHLTVYRDCDMGAPPSSGQIKVDDHPSINSISVGLDTAYDISPDCREVPGGPSQIECSGGGGGAIQKVVLSSSPVNLTGTPPPGGWTFYWSAQTRSTGPTNLISPGTKGITLRSVMYPRPAGVSPCQSASPDFPQPPVTILCRGSDVRWSGGAVDPDSDSLSYEWAKALDKTSGANFDPPSDPVPLAYESGFSFDKPFTGIRSGTGNVPDRLNPGTGGVVLQDPAQGDLNYVLKISSWQGGQKVAEVYREGGLVIADCPGSTSQPEIRRPFASGFKDTFQVGQSISVPIRAVDQGNLQNGSDQIVSLSVESEALGSNYTNAASGCPEPPCATLSSPPLNASTDSVSTTLEWDLTCAHLSSGSPEGAGRYKRYNFLLQAEDDHCSVPGRTQRTLSIYVENKGPAPPPDLNCVTRSSGGDIGLSWTSLSGSHPSFDAYVIYRASNENGPYTPLDTVPGINNDNYIDVGAASGPDRYYFIRSLSGCQGKLLSSPSDTLQRLDLTVTDPNNGKAILDWNELATSDQAPHPGTGYYRIYKEHPLGNWTLIDSVPYGTTNFTDTVMVCSDSLSYRIGVADHKRNCVSMSNIDGGTFSDVIAPSVPTINSVSVDTSIGKATIDWDAVPQGDTKGYLVLQIIAGNEYVIDTVWGRTNTFYTYAGSNAPITSENFAIAAFDSCYSGTPPRPNTSTRGPIHNSMNLTGEKKVCNRRMKLSWNPYRNWEGGVDAYRVYYIEQGKSPHYVGRTQAGDTSMTHGPVPLNEEFCYVVQAVSNAGRKALSDKECFFMDFPKPPDLHYLASASVLPSNKGVEIRSIADTSSGVSSFRLERKLSSTDYQEVRTVPDDRSRIQRIKDTSAKPSKYSYSYRVIVEDTCGNDILSSNLGKSIHLSTDATREPPINVLQWSSYGNWDGQVTGYEIHLIDRKKGTDELIDVVAPMRRSYEHKVDQGVEEENGRYCYYVLARESGNSYGRNEVARSNSACAYQKPYIHIPNAYIVNGASESFNAVTGHIKEEGYRLRIYDRWGQKIYETQDPEKGWKGRDSKGELVPEGAYVYHFTFRTSRGKRVERRGGVTLLRR